MPTPVSVDAPPDEFLQAPETRRYLADTVRVWLGLPAAAAVEPPELPAHLARLFLRLEENERPLRDRWGCWDYAYSENFHAGRLWEPEVDRWLAERRADLSEDAPLESLWPAGRPFALCLTHDVDLIGERLTPRQIVRHARAGFAGLGAEEESALLRLARPPARVARSLRRVARAPSARETIERSVALESERGLTASYFFTVPPLGTRSRWDCAYAPEDRCLFQGQERRVADVMRTLADEGFDVGLHGSYQAGIEPGALAEEREALDRATGLEITTTRQHFLHWDVRWTPSFQEQAGFRADSSLGFNRNVGFRAGTSLPFRHFDPQSGRTFRLLEAPLILQDSALLGDEIGLGLDLELARRVVRQLLDAVADIGGTATFSFHPDKLVRPDWLRLYEWTLDYALAEGAWVTSLRGLEEWWRAREARVLGG
jgi:hypothetical protein